MAAESESTTTTIQSVWAQRCAEDLAANREKQSGIAAQISELQEQLAQLLQDETWLVARQKHLSVPSAPVAGDTDQTPAGSAAQEAGAGEDAVASSVPQPRQEAAKPAGKKAATKATAAKRTTGKTAAAKKAPASNRKSPGKKAPAAPKATITKTTAKPATGKTTAVKKAAAKPALAKPAAAKKAVPAQAGEAKQPLQALVLAIVSASTEPRLAREVVEELVKQHPDQATSVQTVRNTLETLVKKQSIEKTNQQGSVMYCAKKSPTDTPAADAELAPSDEKAPAHA
ncbi:hypothetical protein ACF08B_41180 [Streptomyces sp. NPDC015139]|uniref:hypothetical protein n=1 Tax=Streptomyces sp. NPDC015139 TaxID=3364942 RepID=UPI0036FBE9CE